MVAFLLQEFLVPLVLLLVLPALMQLLVARLAV
jgi:hypothetical protein